MAKSLGTLLLLVALGVGGYIIWTKFGKSGGAPMKSMPTFVSAETEKVFGRQNSPAMLGERIHMLIPAITTITNETGPVRQHTRLEARVHDKPADTIKGIPAHKRYVGEWVVDGQNKPANVTFEFIQTPAGFEFDGMTMFGRTYGISEITVAGG